MILNATFPHGLIQGNEFVPAQADAFLHIKSGRQGRSDRGMYYQVLGQILPLVLAHFESHSLTWPLINWFIDNIFIKVTFLPIRGIELDSIHLTDFSDFAKEKDLLDYNVKSRHH